MSALLSRIEVEKLADDLDTTPDRLAFLGSASAASIRSFRGQIAQARYAAHAKRLRRLAALSKVAPGALAAKIAEHALGPELSARVATQLEPADAAGLTRHVKPDFLCEIALKLDPSRSGPVLAAMPDALVIDVGRRLVERGEYVVLARYCSSFPTSVALAAIVGATPGEVLTIGMYTEDSAAISQITEALPEDVLVEMGRSAVEGDRVDDLVALQTMLTPAALARSARTLGEHRDTVAARAAELGYPDLLA